MRRILYVIFVLILLNGCVSSKWSYVENRIRKKIPLTYLNHNTGIIVNPQSNHIKNALIFGQLSKDNNALDYAYIEKAVFNKVTVYTRVYTPLHLISMHSINCAKEYLEIDSTVVDYLKKMKAVKVSITPQVTNTISSNPYLWTTHSYKQEFILLRDGIRIPTINELPALNRNSPFDCLIAPSINETQEKILNQTMQYTQNMTAMYTREQKILYCQNLKKSGFDNSYIVKFTGFPADSVNVYIGNVETVKNDVVYFTENDNIYSIEELKKPGIYEIVFRTPKSNKLLSKGDEEKRFPIDFRRYK